MKPEEAKNIMEEMYKNSGELHLPKGFDFAIYVPIDIADSCRIYYEEFYPFNFNKSPFAAGEVFYYKGVRCFTS